MDGGGNTATIRYTTDRFRRVIFSRININVSELNLICIYLVLHDYVILNTSNGLKVEIFRILQVIPQLTWPKKYNSPISKSTFHINQTSSKPKKALILRIFEH